jgi:hypothetical protein
MTLRAIITSMTLLLVTHVSGQTRTLTGKIIDNEFNPLAQVSIFRADTVLLAKSDKNGNFSITVPTDTKALIVADVGMEWKSLDLLSDCNNLEIILQLAATYDFISPAKVDRLRKKEFDKLPELHQSAFAKGIFKTDKPCYIDKFISHKKEMIERHKARTQQPST